MSKPRVGISACLLGRPVRFDGGHKRHDWICDDLAVHVEWAHVCPEVALGLGVPRDTVRLQGTPHRDARLVITRTAEDLTVAAVRMSHNLIDGVGVLDGFILKKESPTCGLERVKVYSDRSGMPARSGVGVFARCLRERLPLLPMIEEGRLSDVEQRERFVTLLFAHHRLRTIESSVSQLQVLHRSYKLLLLEHSPALYRELGRIVANEERLEPASLLKRYAPLFIKILALPTSRGRRANVLEHAVGYFKDRLDSREKRQVLEAIHDYRAGALPLIAPLTLLRHLVRKFSVEYLEEQRFFWPEPEALHLRNAL